MKERHIYIKERLAAVCAMEAFWEKHSNTPFFLVQDNTAVAWGLRHGFSDNVIGDALIQRVKHILPWAKIFQVVSADNPTDCHSRSNFDEYPERRTRLEAALKGDLLSTRTGQRKAFMEKQMSFATWRTTQRITHPRRGSTANLWSIS